MKQLKALLRKQASLLEEFAVKEHELQDAVIRRDWPAMDSVMPKLEHLSRSLESVERRRHVAVDRIKKSAGVAADAPFAELVSRAGEIDRTELTALFRELQIHVLRVKNQTGGIDAYVRNSMKTANTVLGEVFPERKGTIYSRHGRRSPLRGSAMVLNREL